MARGMAGDERYLWGLLAGLPDEVSFQDTGFIILP